MDAALPSAACMKGTAIMSMFEFHVCFYSFVSVFGFSASICFPKVSFSVWAWEGQEAEILAQNNTLRFCLHFFVRFTPRSSVIVSVYHSSPAQWRQRRGIQGKGGFLTPTAPACSLLPGRL